MAGPCELQERRRHHGNGRSMLNVLALIVAAAMPSPAPSSSCVPVTTAFIGSICAPRSPGKHPAIVLLGGSEGGNSTAERLAPIFAQHGYVAVAVAYFGTGGLPKELVDVPVEPVGKAIEAAAERPDVDASRIAVFGLSKGGELALLAASLYSQVHAVIADVPSPFAWQGISQRPAAESSWTHDGTPRPYVAYSSAMIQVFSDAFTKHAPLALRAGYDGSMSQNAAQIPAAMFHLENVRGPILFLAAEDDQVWNSVRQSQLGLAYLKDHHHAFADREIDYPDAGHMFLFATPERPFLSAPFGGLTLEFGGTPAGNVAAAKAAWPQIFAFLDGAF